MKTFRSWLASRGGATAIVRCQQLRSLQSCFLVNFVADTTQRSMGVNPACTEAREGIPPRPLGVGVVDEV